ncbi:MAG TPA: enoyl-CoA hydratase-related protein [Gemmatimonadales bacterium]|jgi:2-(1,2-epoxy-1,2-dihydrophenyl)acetyl-CoA isomerase
MAYENVLVEVADRVGTLTLNRPDKLNAFAGTMRREIADAIRGLAGDDGVRVIVVTGAGRAFCAGADIGYMKELTASRDVAAFRALVEAGREVVTVVRATPKPVIASVNGPAAGGGANFALACDLRIASDQASIGQTFNRIGLHPDWGGTFFLPRLVGASRALELIFGADMVSADEALRLGLFSRVVPHDQLAAATREVALGLARKPPRALALAKKAVYASDRHSLDDQLDMELAHQLSCFQSEDAREGLAAFLEKRAPEFRGR